MEPPPNQLRRPPSGIGARVHVMQNRSQTRAAKRRSREVTQDGTRRPEDPFQWGLARCRDDAVQQPGRLHGPDARNRTEQRRPDQREVEAEFCAPNQIKQPITTLNCVTCWDLHERKGLREPELARRKPEGSFLQVKQKRQN